MQRKSTARAATSLDETQVAAAQKAVADTAVYAPISGYVSDKVADVGEYSSPSAPNTKVATIVRTCGPLLDRQECLAAAEVLLRLTTPAEQARAEVAAIMRWLAQGSALLNAEACRGGPQLPLL